MTNSVPEEIIKYQAKDYEVEKRNETGRPALYIAHVRHDDRYDNGYEIFSITCSVYTSEGANNDLKRRTSNGRTVWLDSRETRHEIINNHFPELSHMLKWHLVSTDGPMYYIENAMYWAGMRGYCNGGPSDPPNIDHFKSTVVWGAVEAVDFGKPWTLDERSLREWLDGRLSVLLDAFKCDVEALGFKFSELKKP